MCIAVMASPASAEVIGIRESQSGTSTQDYKTIEQVNTRTRKYRKYCYRQKGNIFDHIAYFCCLSAASYIGVFSRIYLSKLSNWNGVPLFSSLYAQMVGSCIMGLVTSHKLLLAEKHAFLYQAIATGLCGSITTFSSWNLEAVSALLQVGQVPPNNLVRIFGWVTTLLLGVGMAVGSYTVGRHLAVLSPWSDYKQQQNESVENTNSSSNCHAITILVSIWLTSTFLVIFVPYKLSRHDFIFSALFGSIGTYIRWHLAPLNSVFLKFKLGTFLVNVLGAWLLAGIVYAIGIYNEGEFPHYLLTGVATGFCGCLTSFHLCSRVIQPSSGSIIHLRMWFHCDGTSRHDCDKRYSHLDRL